MAKHTEAEVSKIISEKTNGLVEYVSGYTKKENPVTVRCETCGETYSLTFHHITTHWRGCPVCKRIDRQKRQMQEQASRMLRQRNREQQAKDRKAEAERKRLDYLQAKQHPCPVCGEITTISKYCSPRCRIKAHDSAHEYRRRILIKSAMVDKDITVEGLFRRDHGVCAICGKRCDYEDYTMRDGAFIAGDWYPSVDHIKPLSLGGSHSWDNIQLAHRRCNTLKSNNFAG